LGAVSETGNAAKFTEDAKYTGAKFALDLAQKALNSGVSPAEVLKNLNAQAAKGKLTPEELQYIKNHLQVQ
jgi:hypothetical protein